MPKEDTSSASIRQINLVKEALKVPMTAELRAELEARLAELQAEVPPDARGASLAPLEQAGLPEGDTGAGLMENPRLEPCPLTPEPEKDTPTRDIKIAMIRERLKGPVTASTREKLEAMRAELSGEKPRVKSPPKVAALPPLVKAEPLEPPPAVEKTVKIWTPQGYIEVKKGDTSGTPKITKPSETVPEDAVPPTAPKPVPPQEVENRTQQLGSSLLLRPKNGTDAQGVDASSLPPRRAEEGLADSLSRISRRAAEEPRGKVGTYELRGGTPARTAKTNEGELSIPRAKTRWHLITLIAGAAWATASILLADDLFGFATFAFPGVVAAGLIYAILSRSLRKSRPLLLSAVAAWVSVALFIGFHDCCISPAQAHIHFVPLDPQEHYHALKTAEAVRFEIIQIATPGILLGLIGWWWLKKSDEERLRRIR